MITTQLSNPFLLMMNPEEVMRAVESSDRLQCLRRKVFRPLDGPAPKSRLASEAASFDALIDDDDDPVPDLGD